MEGLDLTSAPINESITPINPDFEMFKNLTLQEVLNMLRTFNC